MKKISPLTAPSYFFLIREDSNLHPTIQIQGLGDNFQAPDPIDRQMIVKVTEEMIRYRSQSHLGSKPIEPSEDKTNRI